MSKKPRLSMLSQHCWLTDFNWFSIWTILVSCEYSIKRAVNCYAYITINHTLPYQHTFRILNEMHNKSFFFFKFLCLCNAFNCTALLIEIFGRFQVQSTRFNNWIRMWSLNESPMIGFDLNRSTTKHISNRIELESMAFHFTPEYKIYIIR